MFQYLLLVLAALAVFGVPSVETLSASGAMMDYIVAAGIALMLKPWLQSHFE